VMQPLLGCFEPRLEPVTMPTLWLDQHNPRGLNEQNAEGTHLGLGKDAPLRRSVQRSGTIFVTPLLSGWHHGYARI